MAFQLNSVVPWGRNLSEYKLMFTLTDEDMQKNLAGFGDGPASFNCEATEQGYHVTSFDPIYQFSTEELRARIDAVRPVVMQQMRENMDNYVWTNIKNLAELEDTRMSAMRRFLADYERGRRERRYICHALPERLPYEDGAFDIGLSSHFLLMYTMLGYEFHIRAMTEMLRVCREIRVFPIVDLDANRSEMVANVIAHFREGYDVEIRGTGYAFQKGENQVLIVRNGRGVGGKTRR